MGTVDIGVRLRSNREALGLSLEDLARRTRVQPRILDAIERNDLARIPPRPYGRGFIKAYAREVGLDSEETVRDYFAQFPPAVSDTVEVRQPEPWPRQTSWIVPAAGLMVAALVLAAVAQGGRTGRDDDGEPAAVGTSGSRAAPAAALPEQAPAIGRAERGFAGSGEARNPPGARGPASQDTHVIPRDEPGLSIVLLADRQCWVAATADGTRVLYELLQPGARHTIQADREVTLRAGDAGALRLGVNGANAEVFGRDGQVRTARITAPDTTTGRGDRRVG